MIRRTREAVSQEESKTCEDLIEELRRKHKLDERCIPKTAKHEKKPDPIPIGLCD